MYTLSRGPLGSVVLFPPVSTRAYVCVCVLACVHVKRILVTFGSTSGDCSRDDSGALAGVHVRSRTARKRRSPSAG